MVIDATSLKTHRTETSPRLKTGVRGDLIGRTTGGTNTTRHAVTDSVKRPIRFFVRAGQVSEDFGVRALCGPLPAVDRGTACRGHDADWFRGALEDNGIGPCVPGRKSHDTRRYMRRNRNEIVFGGPTDWRRVAGRYDRCPRVFLSAVALAVIFWPWSQSLEVARQFGEPRFGIA
ncbi:Transposase [Palleronia rufa]